MRIRTLIAATVIAVLVLPAAAGAAPKGRPAESGFKVTGGGQIIADDSANGAGDTVGFNAQEMDGDDPNSDVNAEDAARGQFQYVPRGQGGPAAPSEKFHGVVTCLVTASEVAANEEAEDDGNVEDLSGAARFGGYIRGTSQAFTVDVTDNGQGANASGTDMILVRLTATPCADNPEDEEQEADELVRLGRGNVKIHNNPDGAAASRTSALAL